ncbi:hypothetical protein HOLleu_02416 [Holothuria leucospilota]|uniref:Uncharacterized protein n=1 Tax=Holothuria leucospilota TaxID=206669 RepID=A0A9Q1HLC1_HOLLE|nr:hypothetical protein HOLleu_02416 [Holothuria leucospilota]
MDSRLPEFRVQLPSPFRGQFRFQDLPFPGQFRVQKKAGWTRISISRVCLYNCYSTVDLRGGNHLQLKSSLSIPVLTTLNDLTIEEQGREITSEEFTGILQYSSKCLALKELWFFNCLLPPSVQAESVSVLRSRNVKGNIQYTVSASAPDGVASTSASKVAVSVIADSGIYYSTG